MKSFISRNIASLVGKSVNKKILVIESDDWGSIRMPSKRSFENLLKNKIPVDKCPYNTFDALESVEDIEMLLELCFGFKDFKGNPLKITANFIMANPEFEKIARSGFEKYFYQDFKQTYLEFQGSTKTFQMAIEGMVKNIFIPQLHAREHLQVNYWLNALRDGDKETRIAFDEGVWGHPSAYKREPGISFLSAFHINSYDDLEFSKQSIFEASDIFIDSFGFKSQTFIPPRFIWPKELEPTFYDVGIRALQGKIIKLSSKIGDKRPKLREEINWMGKPNSAGLKYLIRNVFFEPTQKPQFSWESDAMNRIDTAFFWGKPAVVSMHRLNFMGGLSEENRYNGLSRLRVLIKTVLKKYPDIEFMTSNELYNLVYGE